MFLGIEIGGTKLQLGVGRGDGEPLAALQRLDVQPQHGADGIRRQLEQAGRALVQRWGVTAVGFGFGGPVDAARGRTIVSHQIEGWRDFPLADWGRETFALPALVVNDSDSAGLAEARFGAGRGRRVVFYSNVGSGIGGALVIDGQLYSGGGGVASELGHLRPGLECDRPEQTVESRSSGWAITARVRDALAAKTLSQDPAGRIAKPSYEAAHRGLETSSEACAEADAADLVGRCGGSLDRLSVPIIAAAAAEGNALAAAVIDRACRTYAWALAQMITLLAPNMVVLGGGVSLMDESLWLAPLRQHVRRYVFPPLADSLEIAPAKLGEEVVVHGVLALVGDQQTTGRR